MNLCALLSHRWYYSGHVARVKPMTPGDFDIWEWAQDILIVRRCERCGIHQNIILIEQMFRDKQQLWRPGAVSDWPHEKLRDMPGDMKRFVKSLKVQRWKTSKT